MENLANTERFWERVDKSGTCWLWRGRRQRQGYGTWSIWLLGQGKGRSVLAHRWAFELTNGAIPEGLELNHKCRTLLCVNPAHLEALSRADHMVVDADTRKHCRRYRAMRRNTSGYANVTWHRQCERWQAQVRVREKAHYLGLFAAPEDAANAVARFRAFEVVTRVITA